MQTDMFLPIETMADKKFRLFHMKNPQVYFELVALARQGKRAGRKKLGIKMLFEVVRWNRLLSTTDADFKLNNNYHSRYARLIMDNEEDLTDIFETSRAKSQDSGGGMSTTQYDPNCRCRPDEARGGIDTLACPIHGPRRMLEPTEARSPKPHVAHPNQKENDK